MGSPYIDNRIDRRQLTETNKINNNLFDLLLQSFFVSDKQPPIINIVSYSATKLSRISGKSEISITFSSNKDLLEWEVRADGTGVGGGDLITNGGPISANTDFIVSGIQLTWGDRAYRINIYGRSTEGVWNNYG